MSSTSTPRPSGVTTRPQRPRKRPGPCRASKSADDPRNAAPVRALFHSDERPVASPCPFHAPRTSGALQLDLDRLVAPLRDDTTSGALALARRAALLTAQVAGGAPAGDAAELQRVIEALVLRVLDAQPAMAPLVELARRVLLSLDRAASLPQARRAAAAAARAFGDSLETSVQQIARRALEHLPAGRVLTVSSSSAVDATLTHASRSRAVEVVCLESRLMSEGRDLARSLADASVPLVYAVDAALESLLPSCKAVLLGADSVGDQGVVNKIGSLAAARSAKRHGIPVLVLAGDAKLLPPGFPQVLADDRPPAEVWGAPPGVAVWNRYFEVIPLSSIDLIVTERAALGEDEIERVRIGRILPHPLHRWAASRR